MTEGPLVAEFVDSISKINAESWNGWTNGNPFVSHAFLNALEQSGCVAAETGWQPYHIILRNSQSGVPVGFMPCYIKSHSFGEYVFDHAWAGAFERAGGNYYPKLQSSVPFTPVTTPRLLAAPGMADQVQSALLNAVQSLVEKTGLSSAHLTFLQKKDAKLAETHGYMVRTDQQFHWQNQNYVDFKDFLDSLSSRKRKQIKKERQIALSTGIEIEQINGADITEGHWDHFFEFYQDTGTRKWGQPYLNRTFFSLINASMAENILLFMCKRDGKYIAGALNFLGPDTLYGRYWGCREEQPCLHFEACYYRAIDYAIANGLSYVEAGAQGPHKLARGYSPVKTYSAHWITNPDFRDAISRFLVIERQEIDADIDYLSARTPFKSK